MAETTSAPSLLEEPSTDALRLARQNGGAAGELCERIAWALDLEAFRIWELSYLRKSGEGKQGPTWDQLSVGGRRDAARKRAAEIVAGPLAGRLIDPTTLTEAVAAARAEGWQPIETAPKDGTTVVDLFNGYRHTGFYWDADQSGGGGWSDTRDRWLHRQDRRGVYGATHWMPPPSDPTGIPGRLSTIPCTGVDDGPLSDFAPPTTPGGRTNG